MFESLKVQNLIRSVLTIRTSSIFDVLGKFYDSRLPVSWHSIFENLSVTECHNEMRLLLKVFVQVILVHRCLKNWAIKEAEEFGCLSCGEISKLLLDSMSTSRNFSLSITKHGIQIFTISIAMANVVNVQDAVDVICFILSDCKISVTQSHSELIVSGIMNLGNVLETHLL